VVLHALPTLHQAEIPHKTKVAVAHASQSAIPEHAPRMHLPTIPSNLDGERLKNTVKYLTMRTVFDFDRHVAQGLEIVQPLLVARGLQRCA
jgi:hypothetical protein